MNGKRWSLWTVVMVMCGVLLSVSAAERSLFEGRPSFKEGEGRAYYVWCEGDRWHVRWTTFGSTNHFSGRVEADGGELKSLKRIDVEVERRVVAPGRPPHVVRGPYGRVHGVAPGRPARVVEKTQDHIVMDGDRTIRFDTKTQDDLDGFDFKVEDKVKALRFVLRINGQPVPKMIEVGRNNARPAGNPFIVTF